MFRPVLCLAAFFALPAWADDFQVQAPVLAAKVYAQGASLTRAILVDLPSGVHRVLIPVPPGMDFQNPPQIGGLGEISVGAIEVLPDFVVDAEQVYSEAQQRALAAVQEAEVNLRLEEENLQRANDAVLASEVRIGFLREVRADGSGGLKAADLRDIGVMLAEETLVARAALQAAQAEGLRAKAAVDVARTGLAQAKQDLARLLPPEAPVDMLAITVTVPEPVFANLTLSHFVFAASWRSSYTMDLNRAEGFITLARQVRVAQNTGEVWRDVALSLSTGDPLSQAAPREVAPNRAMIADINRRGTQASGLPQIGGQGARAEMVFDAAVEEPLVIQSDMQLEGENIRYDYPLPVSVAPGGGLLSLALDELVLETSVINRAAPRFDDTAFTIAKLTNTLDEPILPGEVSLLRDGVLVGQFELPLIPAGAEAELPFGAVEGLRLDYKLLDNNTGDRGILTSSNTRSQDMEFSIENLTGEATTVEALFALPFSEEEDLELGVVARPQPDLTAVDGKRGVAQWNLELSPGQTETVRISVGLTWPEGFELFWQP